MSLKRRIRRDIQRSWSVGRQQIKEGSHQLERRNTGITSNPNPPLTPISPSDEPDSGLKFKVPYKRRATVPASMMAGRGNGSSKGAQSNGTTGKGFVPGGNGSVVPRGISPAFGRVSPVSRDHDRFRHFSSGSGSSHNSRYSEDPEMSLSELAGPSNFFDFDENADDIYLAPPEEHVHKLRKEEKKRRSIRKDSITAQPFTPLNVETIGGAYVEEEGAMTGSIRQGSKIPGLSSIPEAGKPSFKPSPVSTSLTRFTPPDTPTTKDITPGDIIARDERIAQLEREIEDWRAARWKAPPIPDTIDRILMGQSYCLEWYKSMEQKRALLDAAIDSYDGNCITTVLLFIRKTLNPQILMKMLRKRPGAIHHYCSFLKQLHAWKELTSVYQTLGDYESLGYLKLRECEDIPDPDQRVRQLQTCLIMFKTTPVLEKDTRYVEEYLKLTKKQKQIKTAEMKGSAKVNVPIMFTPLTTTLLYCCRTHSSAPETHVCSPEALRAMFSISEKQFFQVCLLGFTLTQNWPAIESLLTSKGVFGIGKKRKSPIGFERVVRTLGNPKLNRRAPDEVLKRYLLEVEDMESRLTLATYTQVFDVGIETLKQMRYRERLRSYINQIPISRQGEYRGKINALVDNTQLKWKTEK